MKLDYRTWGFFSREQAIKGFELYRHGNVKLDKAWDVGYIDLSGRVKDGRVYEATVMLHLARLHLPGEGKLRACLRVAVCLPGREYASGGSDACANLAGRAPSSAKIRRVDERKCAGQREGMPKTGFCGRIPQSGYGQLYRGRNQTVYREGCAHVRERVPHE